jgi:hypothetical protein
MRRPRCFKGRALPPEAAAARLPAARRALLHGTQAQKPAPPPCTAAVAARRRAWGRAFWAGAAPATRMFLVPGLPVYTPYSRAPLLRPSPGSSPRESVASLRAGGARGGALAQARGGAARRAPRCQCAFHGQPAARGAPAAQSRPRLSIPYKRAAGACASRHPDPRCSGAALPTQPSAPLVMTARTRGMRFAWRLTLPSGCRQAAVELGAQGRGEVP